MSLCGNSIEGISSHARSIVRKFLISTTLFDGVEQEIEWWLEAVSVFPAAALLLDILVCQVRSHTCVCEALSPARPLRVDPLCLNTRLMFVVVRWCSDLTELWIPSPNCLRE